jgi:branched-chain amino acid transport system substrate-binding protein
MNKKTIFSLIVLLLIAVAAILVTYKNNEDSNTVKIGYFAPLTGPAAETSEQMFNSFKLAYSQNPSVNGKNIKVIYEDDGCDPKKAVTAAKKFIEVDKVDILVSGVCSGSTLAVAPIAEANKIILFTPVSTTPKLTHAGDYVFRVSGSSDNVASSTVLEVYNKLNIKRVAVLFETADYPVGWKDAFKRGFVNLGGQVLSEEGFATRDTDMKSQLLKLSSLKPEAFVISANSVVSVNTIANQMKQLGITNIPVIGNEYFGFKQSLDNPNTDGFYSTLYKFDSNNVSLVNLKKDYKAMFNKLPDVEIYSALTFDGYNVLKDVIGKCQIHDESCYKKELYSIRGYEGASGIITIDENGDTYRDLILKKIQNKELVDF